MKARTGVDELVRIIGDDVETLRLVVDVAEAFARRSKLEKRRKVVSRT